jgi:hypothetical protein
MTAERSFFENKASFRKYLMENYPSSTVYLAMNNLNAVFELNTVGFTGCLGKAAPAKNQTLQGLHDIFHARLNKAYMTLISLLDASAGKLGNAIHCLTADSYLPPAAKEENKLKAQTIALVPRYLPNHSNRQSLFPNFQDFFAIVVENSHDDAIFNLTNPALLDNMNVKTQQKVLTALLQFSYGLKARLTALLSGLNLASNFHSLSSILFRRNQNPSTFIFTMLSLAPNLDENFQVESFLIISKKIFLLQEIAVPLQSPFFRPYLSRADFILCKRIVDIENLTETSTQSNSARTKRSTWGNFWSSVWGCYSRAAAKRL